MKIYYLCNIKKVSLYKPSCIYDSWLFDSIKMDKSVHKEPPGSILMC